MYPKDQVSDVPSSGTAYKTYLKMAWPCVLEAMLLCLVTVIDTIMVSDLGENAIAAVGITSQPKFLLIAMILSLNIGVTAVIARRTGEGNQRDANRILKNVLALTFSLGLLTACTGFFFAEEIMTFVGAESNYIEDATMYFQIISIGIFFQSINLTINAAQRGVGKTKITMQTNAAANIVNVVFNYILIYGKFGFPTLGVKGAAIATAMGCGVGCLIAITTLLRRKGYINIFLAAKERFNLKCLQPVIKVSSSAFVEQVCLRVGFLVYTMVVVRLGTTPYATHLICMSILNFSFSFGDGIAAAASTLVGLNLGAREIQKAKMYGQIGQRIAGIVSIVLCCFFFFGRYKLLSLYTEDPEVIALGSGIMIIITLVTHIQTAQIVYNGCLRGAGDSKYVAKISFCSAVFIRPLLTYMLCFPLGLGLYGAWIGLMIDQFTRFYFGFRRFKGGKWSELKL